MSEYVDYYQKYKEEYGAKYGSDYCQEYVGSAFHSRPEQKQEINGSYLRDKMPNKEAPKKKKIIDIVTADCDRVMEIKASDGKFKCTYRIKEIYPGVPVIHDTNEIMKQLFRRISAREGVLCYAENDHTLVITWARRNK